MFAIAQPQQINLFWALEETCSLIFNTVSWGMANAFEKVLDFASGNVISTSTYSSFGTLSKIGTTTSNRGYTNHQMDGTASSSDSLIYMNARYQKPDYGVFISSDPVTQTSGPDSQAYLHNPQNLNAYAYVRNNPIMYTDPTGQFSVSSLLDSVKSGIQKIFSGNTVTVTNPNPTVTTNLSNSNPAPTNQAKNQVIIFNSYPTWDKSTDNKISTLKPEVQPYATTFINRVDEELGVKLRVTDAYRSPEEQNRLYWQSRTNPPTGPWATNAKGGESNHNFGTAIDVSIIDNGKAYAHPISNDIVKIGQEENFDWGGNWTQVKDYPHFEFKNQ